MTVASLPSRPLWMMIFGVVAILAGCHRESRAGFEGYVEGKYVYVASPQGGRLEQLSVSRGDVVNTSHPLFTLDREPEAAAVQPGRATSARRRSPTRRPSNRQASA